MTPIFRARRTTAFDRLYRQHVASVYRYAHAVLGNRADAEDVTQQTFLNAYRAWAQGTKPRKAENWLLTIAHNEVRRHFRKASGRSLEVEYDDKLAQPAPERIEPSVADVLRALQHLPATQREALVMREFEGRSYAEIAEIMGVTQGALEALIFRARRTLAEQLEDGLTCAEAEQALSRRLDGRLRRRDTRALKRHLRECPACTRFEQVQKEQRSLLGGLAVMPVPASLYLLKGESATAALGITTGAAAAGGVGGTVAGAGVAGVATGVAVKAVAVTAAVAVAGGVGYGVATEAQALAGADRPEARAAAVVPKQEPRREVVLAAAGVRPRSTLVASPTQRSTPRSADAETKKTKKAKALREMKTRRKSVQRGLAADAPKLKLRQAARSVEKAAKARVAKARRAPEKSARPTRARANAKPKAKAAATPKTKTKAKANADAQLKAKAESKPDKTARPEPVQKKPEPAADVVAPPNEQSGLGSRKNAGG
jgi:RNA polymerase sigma factor (sigma-70 family)